MLSLLPPVLVLAAWFLDLRPLVWVAIALAVLSLIVTLRAKPEDFGRVVLPSGRVWLVAFPVTLAAAIIAWAVGVGANLPLVAWAAVPLGALMLISWELLRRNSHRVGLLCK